MVVVVAIARCDETRAADTLSLGQAPLAATSSTVIVITQSSDPYSLSPSPSRLLVTYLGALILKQCVPLFVRTTVLKSHKIAGLQQPGGRQSEPAGHQDCLGQEVHLCSQT